MDYTLREKIEMLLEDSHERYEELAKRQQEYIEVKDFDNAKSVDLRMKMVGIYVQRLEDILK